MKKIVFFVQSFILLFSLNAQSDGILWRVTGNGLAQPSYIFGTIHLYCHPETLLKRAITTAVDTSDIVVLELDLNDYTTLISIYKSSMQESNRFLSDILNKNDYFLVDSLCQALIGDSLSKLNRKSPMELLSRLYASKAFVGCDPMPVDFTIAQLAKTKDKPSYGLESFAFQDSILKAIPDSIQARWLMDFCRNPAGAKTELTGLIEAYNAGKSEELYTYIFNTTPEMAYLNDLMIKGRNELWVNFMASNMKTTSLFVAVGAAHLGGKEGLIALLRKSGYILKPVIINE